jgi:hypothetical protein
MARAAEEKKEAFRLLWRDFAIEVRVSASPVCKESAKSPRPVQTQGDTIKQ